MFFKNKRCFMSLFTLVYAQVCMNYMVPTLAITEMEYGMTFSESGLGFALIALVAAAGAPIWGSRTEVWDLRCICLVGLLCQACATFLIGPGHPLPKSLGIMLAGLALLGVGVSAVQVTSMRTLV